MEIHNDFSSFFLVLNALAFGNRGPKYGWTTANFVVQFDPRAKFQEWGGARVSPWVLDCVFLAIRYELVVALQHNKIEGEPADPRLCFLSDSIWTSSCVTAQQDVNNYVKYMGSNLAFLMSCNTEMDNIILSCNGSNKNPYDLSKINVEVYDASDMEPL